MEVSVCGIIFHPKYFQVLFGNHQVIFRVRQGIQRVSPDIIACEDLLNANGHTFRFKKGVPGPRYRRTHLMLWVLKALEAEGYCVQSSVQLARSEGYPLVLFRKVRPRTGNPPEMFCLQLMGVDGILLAHAEPAVQALVESAIRTAWSGRVTVYNYGVHREMRLGGRPWDGSYKGKARTITARSAILSVIRLLARSNWQTCGLNTVEQGLIFVNRNPVPPRLSTGPELPEVPTFALDFNRRNRLRVIGSYGDRVQRVFNDTLIRWWKPGLKVARGLPNCYEFQLKGKPWKRKNALSALSLGFQCILLDKLASSGWSPLCSLPVSQSRRSETIVFQQTPTSEVTKHCCLAFESPNIVKLLNAPPLLAAAFEEIVAAIWSPGIRRKMSLQFHSELMLYGLPFTSCDPDSQNHGRALLLYLVDGFAARGWSLILTHCVAAESASRKHSKVYRSGIETLYFRKTPGQGDSGIDLDVVSALSDTPSYGYLPSYVEATAHGRPTSPSTSVPSAPQLDDVEIHLVAQHTARAHTARI